MFLSLYENPITWFLFISLFIMMTTIIFFSMFIKKMTTMGMTMGILA